MSKKSGINLRKNATPRVSREVPEVEDMFVRTIFGTRELKTKYCPECYSTKLISDFYYRSRSMRKPSNTHERVCCECWDKQVKERKKPKEPEAIRVIRDLL